MKRTIGITALIIFALSASIEPTSVNPLYLIAWGAVVVASLSVAGMTLKQEDGNGT